MQPFYPVNWIEMLPEKLEQPSAELMSALTSTWPVNSLAIADVLGEVEVGV